MLLGIVLLGKAILWDATCCTGAQKFTSLRVQLQVNLLDGRSDLLLFCAFLTQPAGWALGQRERAPRSAVTCPPGVSPRRLHLFSRRILLNYAVFNPTIGYSQGMSDLVAPLLAEVLDESDTFWCFVGLMQNTIFISSPRDEDMEKQLVRLNAELPLALSLASPLPGKLGECHKAVTWAVGFQHAKSHPEATKYLMDRFDPG